MIFSQTVLIVECILYVGKQYLVVFVEKLGRIKGWTYSAVPVSLVVFVVPLPSTAV